MSSELSFYITCAAGLEKLLVAELKELGHADLHIQGAGVQCTGSLASAYRTCLHSRIANRVLMPLERGGAATPEELYAFTQSIDWSLHLNATDTLAVDCYVAKSAITHSQYAALTVKDAVVDQFRERVGIRPSVDRESPSVQINVYIYKDVARIGIDLSGMSLHRRGYRQQTGRAPLKENLAAALLHSMDWPTRAAAGAHLADPMCGSGTLVIEAALMAMHKAPGLTREYFGFQGWLKHDAALWEEIRSEAESSIVPCDNKLIGADSDRHAIKAAIENAKIAGVDHCVEFVCQDMSREIIGWPEPNSPETTEQNLVISNPPYGERLDAGAPFYQQLGENFSQHYAGWSAALIVSDTRLLKQSRLPLKTWRDFRNGAIDCVLASGVVPASSSQTVDASPFVNRLAKNQRKLKSWLKQSGVSAYRLYDADLPEFAVAVDVYECDSRQVVVQEYQAPATVNVAMAKARLAAIVTSLPNALQVLDENIHVKVREKQAGLTQYEKTAEKKSVGLIEEDGYRLSLNFSDYLDTGLFLDHRKVRRYVQQGLNGKRFLNLFAYTASVTVAAIAGGASSSVSVDLSNNYCEWAQRNFNLNGFDTLSHSIVRSDVMAWLADAGAIEAFDTILLDPPTFSNSNSTDQDWDVQNDHVRCIKLCLKLLKPEGVLIFSTNFRRFKLDKELLGGLSGKIRVEDRSAWSIDRDFERNQRIHQCWFIHPI